MPKIRELVELFQAVGSNELAKASDVARSIALEYGKRGQYQAERQMLSALEMAKFSFLKRNGGSAPHPMTNLNSSLMPLRLDKKLDDIDLPSTTHSEIVAVLDEWRAAEKLARHGIPRRWRLLFCGPSGCGKSITAAALAAESGLPAFIVRFDALIGAYLGQTALRLREVFRFAEETPCVLIFDEVDALAKRRGNPMEVGELDRIVIAFMQELEHATSDGFIVATSNLPKALDDALWRRFDLQVTFKKPGPDRLARFMEKRSREYGFSPPVRLAEASKAASSFAAAEQIVISEVRKRVMSQNT